MQISLNWLFLLITTSSNFVATWLENFWQQPPGKLIDIGGYRLHLYAKGKGNPPVVIDHSLGGIDGYFLIDEIAKITRVCIYDRAGYGWSEMSPKPRCTQEIVQELDTLLTRGGIEPPYLLVGDSFGSYNVRLYAHYFPEKVAGIVLTDGLHEREMLKLSLSLKLLQLFFMSGFAMSTIGSILGIVRLLGEVGIFTLLKKELRHFPSPILKIVKRSFYRPQHWLTMWREISNLDASARQVIQANNFGSLPLVSIKSKTFLRRSIFNFYIPVKAADRLREKMHADLLKLSTNCRQLSASHSSHFVWVDEPEIIKQAVEEILREIQGKNILK